MIHIHGLKDSSSEYQTAEEIVRVALAEMPSLETDRLMILDLYPSLQCFGERFQDIDLVIFFGNYSNRNTVKTSQGQVVQSFCVSLEVKGHPPGAVRFEGNRCFVRYNNKDHDVTQQSEGQKYSLREYITKNSKKNSSPYITNLIWLQQVPSSFLPRNSHNILGCDSSWQDIIDKIALLSTRQIPSEIACFSARGYLQITQEVFSKTIEPSKIDRKRLEAITKAALDRTKQQYARDLGKQLLIFRGRGGTGKTVRLIRIGYQAYDELGYRVLFLTYNKALVADLKRLLALLKVKDSAGDRSMAIKTIHSFMHEWLSALGIISKTQSDFLENYEKHKLDALKLVQGRAVEKSDIEAARTKSSKSLSWDLILIDESQDWPPTERDLIYELYDPNKVIIADGVDQFVRGIEKIDWRESLPNQNSQIVSLTSSLRLKASLCQAVGYIAEALEYTDWNVQPVPETHGGKVIVVTGDPMQERLHNRLSATARNDGNKPIDMLLCVPPNWVEDQEEGKKKVSRVAKQYKEWGLEYWDAVDPEERDSYPTSLEQYRIVQYESCRGLEGWVVMNFALDEFFEYKRQFAEFSDAEEKDMFFDKDEAASTFAKKWVMIPLTRAIDTLVIHISNPDSYFGELVIDLCKKHPEVFQHLDYT